MVCNTGIVKITISRKDSLAHSDRTSTQAGRREGLAKASLGIAGGREFRYTTANEGDYTACNAKCLNPYGQVPISSSNEFTVLSTYYNPNRG